MDYENVIYSNSAPSFFFISRFVFFVSHFNWVARDFIDGGFYLFIDLCVNVIFRIIKTSIAKINHIHTHVQQTSSSSIHYKQMTIRVSGMNSFVETPSSMIIDAGSVL